MFLAGFLRDHDGILVNVSAVTREFNELSQDHFGHQPINGVDVGVGSLGLFGNDMSDMGVAMNKVIAGRPKLGHTTIQPTLMGLS